MKNVILSLVLLSITASANASTWVGGSGDWNDPAHWIPSIVPTSSDDVYISATVTVTIPAGYTAHGSLVTVTGTATLVITDVTGRLVFSKRIDFLEKPIFEFTENEEWQTAGLYFLQVVQVGQPIWQTKLLVKKD